MKHPGPWRQEYGAIIDSDGGTVADDCHIPLSLTDDCQDDGCQGYATRLVLAAPELLEALKALLDSAQSEFASEFEGGAGMLRADPPEFAAAESLIARIEGGK
jgi:hypothetical protein